MLVGMLSACATATPSALPAPTLTVEIRYRDALGLLLTAEDMGPAYRKIDVRRLDRGEGWGEDTTRLSGYRIILESDEGLFSRVECQAECYLTVSDAQLAYRAYRQQLTDSLESSGRYSVVNESEERLLGDWNRKFTMTGAGASSEIRYLVLRENVLAELVFAGSETPEFSDQAARKARLFDERVFER
jgi:hypothetical protein